MSTLLQDVKAQALQITHLNNEQKSKHMNQHDCGWEDILNKAKDLYKEQMVDGMERWPPACNTRDSKAPPSQYAANLSQAPPPGPRKPKGDGRQKRQRKDPRKPFKNNKKKGNKDDLKKNPKFQPPRPDEKPIRTANGEEVYERIIKERKF